MSDYATVSDIETLKRELTEKEQRRAEAMLPLVSDMIRAKAVAVGKDFDQMIAEKPVLASVAKVVTVDAVWRAMQQDTDGPAMSQESQAGLGYSWSGTIAFPGAGIADAVLNNNLTELGLRKQRYGMMDLWEKE